MSLKPFFLLADVTTLIAILYLLQPVTSSSSVTPSSSSSTPSILIAGSANLDTFLPLKRLPTPGENLTLLPNKNPTIDVPGGKGCNQAIACSKLSLSPSSSSNENQIHFLSRLGDAQMDKSTLKLIQVLQENNVNIDHCQQCTNLDSGRGYVFLEKDTGKVSAVVSGGSNLYGWNDWANDHDHDNNGGVNDSEMGNNEIHEYLDALFASVQPRCLLLQREIPEHVNYMLANYVNNYNQSKRNHSRKIWNRASGTDEEKHCHDTIVIQDVGGEDRPITKEMLSLCDYIMPNESELRRLVETFVSKDELEIQMAKQNLEDEDTLTHDHEDVIKLAMILQANGANNVLVTLSEKGSILVLKEHKNNEARVHYQKACMLLSAGSIKSNPVVDETGAGDCYRAGFAVALSEGKKIQECLKFASAAGALAVTKEGAVPSIPSREAVQKLLDWNDELNLDIADSMKQCNLPRGGGGIVTAKSQNTKKDDDSFPYMFGSRLNSMKDRPELWSNPVDNVREWVKRQGTIKGLGCVDFNWPQHFQSWNAEEAKAALEEVGLVAGAVCLRYPSKFARGAMIHPDAELRKEAIELTKQAAEVARQLGCDEVVVWSAYDGYDYPFQVDYKEKWDQIVHAFQECCDAYPDIKWSIEYKPTDENTRFFTVPSTAAAVLLLKDIDRPNMGLTLDVGHMLMSGENPGQSISMVGDKLFGIQLNDGYTRLAAEDGMMFGSIHPTMALEIMYQLQENNFKGHLYFDTFPQRTDPIKECEYNIKRVKEFWKAAKEMNSRGIKQVQAEHDAVGALNISNDAMKSV